MLSGPRTAWAWPIATALWEKRGNGSSQSSPPCELLTLLTKTALPAVLSAAANSLSFFASSDSKSRMSRPSALGCCAAAARTTRASIERFQGQRP